METSSFGLPFCSLSKCYRALSTVLRSEIRELSRAETALPMLLFEGKQVHTQVEGWRASVRMHTGCQGAWRTRQEGPVLLGRWLPRGGDDAALGRDQALQWESKWAPSLPLLGAAVSISPLGCGCRCLGRLHGPSSLRLIADGVKEGGVWLGLATSSVASGQSLHHLGLVSLLSKMTAITAPPLWFPAVSTRPTSSVCQVCAGHAAEGHTAVGSLSWGQLVWHRSGRVMERPYRGVVGQQSASVAGKGETWRRSWQGHVGKGRDRCGQARPRLARCPLKTRIPSSPCFQASGPLAVHTAGGTWAPVPGRQDTPWRPGSNPATSLTTAGSSCRRRSWSGWRRPATWRSS